MADSIKLLNAIRDSIGGEYAERIPEAVRENIETIGNTILQPKYAPHLNAMFSELMNRISETVVKHVKDIDDTYGIFKSRDVSFGDTIQKIFVDVLEAHAFEGTQTQNPASMLQIEKGTIHVEYTSVDRRMFYKTTLSIAELKEAFINVSALDRLVEALVSGMVRSFALDRYIMMSNTLRKHASYVLQGYWGEYAPDPSTPLVTEAVPVNALVLGTDICKFNKTTGEVEFTVTGAKTFLKKLRNLSRSLKFYHKLGYYNIDDETDAPVPATTNVEDVKVIKAVKTPVSDQVVMLETQVMSEIDVDALAVLFHMDKAEIEARMIELENEVLSYPVSEDQSAENTDYHIIGAILDKDAVERGKSFEANESFKNPEHQYINYWFHFWGYMAVSKFADFVPIVCEAYTPSAESEGD